MFDIGFSELLVIGIVALIVIGPERLPKVARTLGHLFGRMQRYVNDVKSDIAREMQLDELKKLQSSMQDAARSFESSVTSQVNAVETEAQKLAKEADITAAMQALPPTETPAAVESSPAQTEAAPAATTDQTAQLELELPASAPPSDRRA
jgi:sec-independent protein translocase protein TatB